MGIGINFCGVSMLIVMGLAYKVGIFVNYMIFFVYDVR